MKYIVAFGLCLSLMSWNASVALADPGCNAKTIKGAYGTSASGTITGLDGSHFPLAELGLFTLDGVGNLTGSDTVSIDGNVFPRTFTGTYTVNADCTATVVLTDEFGNVGTTSGVIVDHGDSTLLISVNPGVDYRAFAKDKVIAASVLGWNATESCGKNLQPRGARL